MSFSNGLSNFHSISAYWRRFTHFLSIDSLRKYLPCKNFLEIDSEDIEDLKETSDDFKNLCIRYNAVKKGRLSPIMILDKTIARM